MGLACSIQDEASAWISSDSFDERRKTVSPHLPSSPARRSSRVGKQALKFPSVRVVQVDVMEIIADHSSPDVSKGSC